MVLVFRVDHANLRPMAEDPITGFLIGDAIVSSTGVFDYYRDGKLVRELRHPDDVFSPESLASLAVAPVTLRHPPTKDGLLKSPKDAEGRIIGAVGSPRVDGGQIHAAISLFGTDAIDEVKNKKVRQVSPGYRCEFVAESGVYDGKPYDGRQTKIHYNHIALLEYGRQGEDVGIRLDAADGYAADTDPKDAPPIPSAPEKKTMLIKIGDDAIDLPETHAAVVTASASKLQARIDALTAERDAAKATASSRTDAAALPDLVAKRAAKIIELRDIVGDAVTIDALARIDEADVAKTICKHLAPNVDMTGKSADYIAAYASFCLDTKKKATAEEKKTADTRTDAAPLDALGKALTGVRTDSGGTELTEGQKAYKEMIEKNAARGRRTA